MATVDEINAGFDAAYKSLNKLIATVVPDQNIPFVGNLRSIAANKMDSPDGKKMLLDEVQQVLAAAEAVRAKASAK